MKKKLIIIIAIVVIVILMFPALLVSLCMFVAFLLFAGYSMLTYLEPNPPAPVIEMAEIPVEIVYTINDKEYTLSDAYVCEYEGVTIYGSGMAGDRGEKRRLWSGYLKSTEKQELVLYEDDKVKIYCELGAPGYYMGDMRYADEAETEIYLEDYENRRIYRDIFGREDIKELCDAELISFEIAEPIENEFRYTFKSIFAWVE